MVCQENGEKQHGALERAKRATAFAPPRLLLAAHWVRSSAFGRQSISLMAAPPVTYYTAPDGQLMMRVMQCQQPPMVHPMVPPCMPMVGTVGTGFGWEERHEAAGGLIPGKGRGTVPPGRGTGLDLRHRLGPGQRYIPREDFPANPRPKPQPTSKVPPKPQSAVRVSGGYKVYAAEGGDSGEVNLPALYGMDVMATRYGEVAPRAAPRTTAPRSNPPPHVSKKRDVDGRSFGSLHAELYPTSKLSTTTGRTTSAGGGSGAGGRAVSSDGRRYEGVAGDYDAVASNAWPGEYGGAIHSKQWSGQFGGPFHKLGGNEPYPQYD